MLNSSLKKLFFRHYHPQVYSYWILDVKRAPELSTIFGFKWWPMSFRNLKIPRVLVGVGESWCSDFMSSLDKGFKHESIDTLWRRALSNSLVFLSLPPVVKISYYFHYCDYHIIRQNVILFHIFNNWLYIDKLQLLPRLIFPGKLWLSSQIRFQ